MTKKFHFLFCTKTNFWYKKLPTSLHEKKTGCRQWAPILCMDVHMELTLLPSSTCIHLSLSPLSVNNINRWSLTLLVMCFWVALTTILQTTSHLIPIPPSSRVVYPHLSLTSKPAFSFVVKCTGSAFERLIPRALYKWINTIQYNTWDQCFL